jgi:glycosyltransferase involved in cell wall biosynthesis
MRKVLIISHYFNQRDFTGTVRMQGLAKYLPEYGWSPTVLTTKSTNCPNLEYRVVEISYEDKITKWKEALHLDTKSTVKEQFSVKASKTKKKPIELLLDLWEEIFLYPDDSTGWCKPAFEAANRLLYEEHFDAIVSTLGPASAHMVARDLKKIHNIPWIADFRDLWTLNHNYKHSVIRKYIESRLEIDVLSSADALTTVSDPLVKNLHKLHGKNRKIFNIPNGFDPNYLNIDGSLSNKFNIVYTGIIYKKNEPEILFEALKDLILSKKIDQDDILVDLYIKDEGWIEDEVKDYSLQDIIKIHGFIPRDKAIKRQREAQLLLMLTWNDPDQPGIYTGKIFEYLSARRPIISIGRHGGVVEDLLKETGSGFHTSNIEDTKRAIMEAYLMFKRSGKVEYNGNLKKIERYTHREMAKKFADILDIL